jgi:WD40 repeat protein
LCLGLWALLSALPVPATPLREPASEPILRVETNMHTTLIRRLAVDAPRNRLLSAGDDKTVRVWQMPGARLVSTLRVPIDQGHEGQIFALGVSPDGGTVAVGGWTGWDWEGSASIYFFDVMSGELKRRVGGFKDTITNLVWMPDGQHLAVGLMARAGLHLLRLSDMKAVASDTLYNDKVQEVDVRRDGILAAVSLDGMIRLYDRNLRLLGRRVVAAGLKPTTVRFSPDGNRIAVGFLDSPKVLILAAATLAPELEPDIRALGRQENFTSLAWSSDGAYLYAGGDHRGGGRTPLFRWKDAGRGPVEALPVADNRVTEIMQMPGGAIAFATEDPSVGIMNAEGRVDSYRGPDVVDFSTARIELSEDGAAVRYPLKRGGLRPQVFDLGRGGYQRLDAPPDRPLHGPRTEAPGLAVDYGANGFSPTVNGRRVKLDDYEIARSHAITPDGQAVLLGTEWALRLLDRAAGERWSVKLPAVAWAVNLSRDGRLAVAALSDGTLRWYALRDGREVLAYFPHNNGQDWIAWAPEGYYVSSFYGDQFIGWHVNRGKDLAPDFYRAVQFDRILYRPDKVAAALERAFRPATRGASAVAGGAEFDIRRLREFAPPRVRLADLRVDAAPGRPSRLILRMRVEKNSRPIAGASVFVNNIPVLAVQDRRVEGTEREGFSRQLEIELDARDNEVRIEVFDGMAMGVAETYVAASALGARPAPGKLYLLAIGINDFPGLPTYSLAYAARDAEEFARRLQNRAAGQYSQVVTRILTDRSEQKPDGAVIRQALDFLAQARREDTVMLFLASHGLSDKAGNYYFVPRDAREQDLLAVIEGRERLKDSSLIPWTRFFDALRDSAGRRFLVVDTCHARDVEGRVETHSLMKRSAASQFSMVLASKGDEESQEYSQGNHGLFTYALLQALSGESDGNRDGQVSVQEWFVRAGPLVESLRDKSVGPQTPQLIAPPPLGEVPLMRTPGP